jgi:uncharacterized protein involved in exopolysaccharide biosynthesis
MEAGTMEFGDLVAAFRRRRKQIASIVVMLLVVAAAVAALIPSVYKSTATILIEQQEIPPDLVRSTISSYADQRIQTISQQEMERANLSTLLGWTKSEQAHRGVRRP